MRKTGALVCVLTLATFAGAPASRGAVLGYGVITEDARIDGEFSSLYALISLKSASTNVEVTLFDRNVASADAGFTSVLDNSSPNFGSIVNLLTNGIDDSFVFDGLFFAPPIKESALFLPGGGGPDFKGDQITSVVLRVLTADYVYFEVAAPCDGPCGWPPNTSTITTARMTLGVTVNGNDPPAASAVPEPDFFVIIGGALVGLRFIAVRMHKRRR